MTKPTRMPGLEIRPAGNDVVVHDPAQDKVHVLNASAGHVLELCDGSRSAAEIARFISARSGAPLTVVSGDVDLILAEFAALQLVAEASCDPSPCADSVPPFP